MKQSRSIYLSSSKASETYFRIFFLSLSLSLFLSLQSSVNRIVQLSHRSSRKTKYENVAVVCILHLFIPSTSPSPLAINATPRRKVHQKYTAFARIAAYARGNEPQRVNSARIRTPRSNDRCPGRAAIYSHPCSPCLSVSPPSPTYLHLHPPGSSPAAATSLSFPSPFGPVSLPLRSNEPVCHRFPSERTWRT